MPAWAEVVAMGRKPLPTTAAVEQVMDAMCLLDVAQDKTMWALKALRDARAVLRDANGVLERKGRENESA